jgi:hypothetical protein
VFDLIKHPPIICSYLPGGSLFSALARLEEPELNDKKSEEQILLEKEGFVNRKTKK